jgi:hypothetical protein
VHRKREWWEFIILPAVELTHVLKLKQLISSPFLRFSLHALLMDLFHADNRVMIIYIFNYTMILINLYHLFSYT